MRWFWVLQAAGWALWLADQSFGIVLDLVFRKRSSWIMYPADALLFLAGAPMIAGLLLRPHRQPRERAHVSALLDFLLAGPVVALSLCLVRGVLAISVSPNEAMLQPELRSALRSGDRSDSAGILLSFLAREPRDVGRSSTRASRTPSFSTAIAFYVLNRALEKDIYYTGSWYDIPYSGSFAVFTRSWRCWERT